MSDDNRFPADPAGILAGISTYGDLYEFLERNAYGNWDWEKKVSEVVVAALRAYTVPEEGRALGLEQAAALCDKGAKFAEGQQSGRLDGECCVSWLQSLAEDIRALKNQSPPQGQST